MASSFFLLSLFSIHHSRPRAPKIETAKLKTNTTLIGIAEDRKGTEKSYNILEVGKSKANDKDIRAENKKKTK